MKNSQKGFVVPLLVVIAILVIGGGVYVYVKQEPVSKVDPSIEKTTTTPSVVVFGSDESIKNGQVLTTQQKVVKQIITKATSTATEVGKVTNCGKDMSCLIAIAPTCGPAIVSWSFAIDFMGKPLTLIDNISIMKASSGMCSLTLTTTDIKINNEPAPPEVQQGFMHMKKICTYLPNDLKSVLTNWSLGNISSTDDELGKCKNVSI